MSESAQRVLPHSLEAERSVLGGVLLDAASFLVIRETLEAEHFYHPVHVEIFRAMAALAVDHQPIDELTVAERLRSTGHADKLRAFNGEAYFSELTSSVVTLENIGWHARMVRGKAQVRAFLRAAQGLVARGYGDYGDVDDFMADAARELFAVTQEKATAGVVGIDVVMGEAIAEIEKRIERRKAGVTAAVSTGFPSLDALIVGWEPGDLVIIAARPSMGKTSLVMNAVQAAAENGYPALVFSIEMKRQSLGMRLLSSQAGVNSIALREGRVTDAQFRSLVQASVHLSHLPIRIDHQGSSIEEICNRARIWRADPATGGRIDPRTGKRTEAVIALDYLQIIRGRRRDEEDVQFIGRCTAELKALARDLEVPVLCLSQLNRTLESRPNKRPIMSDLKSSGAIEQDADLILFVYRDAVYNDGADRSAAELIIGKQRNGDCKTVDLRWQASVTRFEDTNMTAPLPFHDHPHAPGSHQGGDGEGWDPRDRDEA